MGEAEKPQDVEFGGAEVPAMHDPDSLELRRGTDHDHFWAPAPDPLHRHPNRKRCMVAGCGAVVDEHMQSQPWAPEPRIDRAGI